MVSGVVGFYSHGLFTELAEPDYQSGDICLVFLTFEPVLADKAGTLVNLLPWRAKQLQDFLPVWQFTQFLPVDVLFQSG